jgi:sulfatase maturation enzyme AslB (radical SAM superfamily)
MTEEAMMRSQVPAELFVLPVGESDYLVYAPLRRAALIANAALVRFLRELQSGEASVDADPETAGFLRKCGVLDGDEEQAPDGRPAGPPRPATATLLLTNACNLRCGYCYAAAGQKRRSS